VSAWETGRGDPGIFKLRSLAKHYNVGADELLMLDVKVSETKNVIDITDAAAPSLRHRRDLRLQPSR
jgi:transcriptional regulator with XRE-family HTH domain